MNHPFEIAGEAIPAGARHRLELPIARLPTETWVSMPLEVVHGRRAGPRLWLSAAVHGDELNGVEIIRQVLEKLDPVLLVGTVIAAPIINVFGFLNQSRYLPDRRDLNRSFPGNTKGSLASRLANLFMSEVVERCTHGIDLHTGSNHRTNWPQIRANLADDETLRCATAFRAPIMINSDLRDGSLREAAAERGIPVLLYEGGEPQRFNRDAIERGVEGVHRVMAALEMCKRPRMKKRKDSLVAASTTWVRARRGGILRLSVELGDSVSKRQSLGFIGDALASDGSDVLAPVTGVVIGLTNNPLVNQGDSLVHIAEL